MASMKLKWREMLFANAKKLPSWKSCVRCDGLSQSIHRRQFERGPERVWGIGAFNFSLKGDIIFEIRMHLGDVDLICVFFVHCSQGDPDNYGCEARVRAIIARENGTPVGQVGYRPWPATSTLPERWINDEEKEQLLERKRKA